MVANAHAWISWHRQNWREGSKHQRLGQYLVNHLADLNRGWYMSLPVEVDCFYDDSKIPAFEAWLRDIWTT